jgi:nicotinamide riboside transporter PnuC
METIYWTTSAFALFGVLLNIKKDRFCFIIWAFTNAIWTLVDFKKEIYAQSALQLVYFGLSIYGFVTWTANERSGKRTKKKTDG